MLTHLSLDLRLLCGNAKLSFVSRCLGPVPDSDRRRPFRPSRFALLFFALVALLPGSALAQEATLTDDARTNSNRPGKNFGADDTVQVRGTIERGLLKFKLTPNLPAGTVGAHVGKATLKLFVGNVGAPGQIVIQRVTAAWTEQSVTDATFPALGAAEASVAIPAASNGKWVTVDVICIPDDSKTILFGYIAARIHQ